MDYPNLRAFGLPSAPIQRHDFQGIPTNRWHFPVPCLPGHYLYSNGDISHSFDLNLVNNGFNWIYRTMESALNALHLHNEKAKIDGDQILNTPFLGAIPPIPNLEDSTYIEFLEPRPHTTITHKWVVANFIPESQEAINCIYLHDNGKAISHQVVIIENVSTGLFNSKEEAQKALDAYRARWNITPVEVVSLSDTIVHKLLEPQIISDTFLLWEVISADNSSFALSHSNTLVHVAYKAHFETFQSALFAKLRYERTHREIKTN